ncbi:hypothetical protein ACFE04_018689 [Oxalis oulophora]
MLSTACKNTIPQNLIPPSSSSPLKQITSSNKILIPRAIATPSPHIINHAPQAPTHTSSVTLDDDSMAAYWDYQFLFVSQRSETGSHPINLRVIEGAIPSDFPRGTYYLTGPGLFTDDYGSTHPIEIESTPSTTPPSHDLTLPHPITIPSTPHSLALNQLSKDTHPTQSQQSITFGPPQTNQNLNFTNNSATPSINNNLNSSESRSPIAFTFDDNKDVKFMAKYVKTDAQVEEHDPTTDTWRFTHRGPFSVLKNGKRFGNTKVMKNVANTSVLKWGGKLLCLWEGGEPYEIQSETLDTVGKFDMIKINDCELLEEKNNNDDDVTLDIDVWGLAAGLLKPILHVNASNVANQSDVGETGNASPRANGTESIRLDLKAYHQHQKEARNQQNLKTSNGFIFNQYRITAKLSIWHPANVEEPNVKGEEESPLMGTVRAKCIV